VFSGLPREEQIKLVAYAAGKVLGSHMTKIRDFLKGKKTYITAIIGVLGALVAWSDGQIDITGLIAAAWAAAQTCFIRAGVATEIQKAQQ
jgi:hypothetical protein